MGRLIIPKTRDYLYIASGTGLSPNINGLRFYDSGLIYYGKKSFYSEDGQYAIWYATITVAAWYTGPIANIGNFTTNSWGKAGATDIITGSYQRIVGGTGSLTISEYKNNISIKKTNLGGGKLTAKPTILELWLKSDAGVILDDSEVIEWTDQSGNSRNFTKSIANTGFPTFSDGAVLFTSSSTYYDSNASVLALPSARLNFTKPYTLFTVIRAGANNSAVFSKSNDNSKRRKYQIAVNGGIIYSLESKNGDDTNIEYDTGTGDDASVKRLIVSQYSSNTFGLLRYNGEQVATGSTDVGIDQTNSASIFIGAAAFGEGTGYNAEASTEMYVYEILFYNQALSTFGIQQIETYLNNKYSIY